MAISTKFKPGQKVTYEGSSKEEEFYVVCSEIAIREEDRVFGQQRIYLSNDNRVWIHTPRIKNWFGYIVENKCILINLGKQKPSWM